MSLISAIFGTVFALHHPVHHHRHRFPARHMVVETVTGEKHGPPIVLSVREVAGPIPFPAGKSFELDNIGFSTVHLTGTLQREMAGHTGIFVRGSERIEASTDPGDVSLLQIWSIH